MSDGSMKIVVLSAPLFTPWYEGVQRMNAVGCGWGWNWSN